MRLLAANNKSNNFLKSFIACENIRFSSLFAAGDVSRGGTCFSVPKVPSGEAKSEEKRMFSQAKPHFESEGFWNSEVAY